jgi:hypothetical protein
MIPSSIGIPPTPNTARLRKIRNLPSIAPTPYSLLPTPYSLLPTPYSLLPRIIASATKLTSRISLTS